MPTVHMMLPNDVDDPATPSGGNTYDRRVLASLADQGWSVREHLLRCEWPRPTSSERAKLASALAEVPDDGVVLLDGPYASAVPDVLAPEARRLRLVLLVHMPFGDQSGEVRGDQLRRLERDALTTPPRS